MIKSSNLRIHGVEEGTDIPTKGIQNLFNEIIAENSPNLGKYMNTQIQEAYRTPNRHDQKGTSPYYIIVKMLRLQNKERILKAAKENCQLTYKGKPIRKIT
jgi:hypothetical protein